MRKETSHIESIKVYFETCEKMIEQHGHYVQFVGSGEETQAFAYTVGRGDKLKPEILMIPASISVVTLINEAAAKTDEQDFELCKVYQSKEFKVNEKPLNYALVEVDPKIHSDKILGVLRRYGNASPVKLFLLLFGDKNNEINFPVPEMITVKFDW